MKDKGLEDTRKNMTVIGAVVVSLIGVVLSISGAGAYHKYKKLNVELRKEFNKNFKAKVEKRMGKIKGAPELYGYFETKLGEAAMKKFWKLRIDSINEVSKVHLDPNSPEYVNGVYNTLRNKIIEKKGENEELYEKMLKIHEEHHSNLYGDYKTTDREMFLSKMAGAVGVALFTAGIATALHSVDSGTSKLRLAGSPTDALARKLKILNFRLTELRSDNP